MHGRLDLATIGRIAATGGRIVGTTQLDDFAGRILHHLATGDEIRIAQADFVACMAVATDETENLMNERAFEAMKPGAYFVNASRGNLVDEGALVRALDSGRLAGCALDVGRDHDQQPSLALARHPNGPRPPLV